MNRLAISNIAWTENDSQVLEKLSVLGVNGVEVAPFKLTGDWETLNTKIVGQYRATCNQYGLEIPSFQAFLFGKPHLQLLSSETKFSEFKDHMKIVAELAAIAGARVLVYGAPKSRLLLDHSYDSGLALSRDRLLQLAEICDSFDVCLGLEAVPSAYGGEIITSYKESVNIVKELNHRGLVLHLDAGCTFLNGDSIKKAIEDTKNSIGHFHVSQPNLGNFNIPSSYHDEASSALNSSKYNKWLCIEMLSGDNQLRSIEEAVEFVNRKYIF